MKILLQLLGSWLFNRKNIDVDYLENQINSMKILNESTGVPQLTAPQLGNYKVYHPEIDEQSAIASLFRTIDDLLSNYEDNLANYQYLKVFIQCWFKYKKKYSKFYF